MKTKKILSVVLVAIMACGLLMTGCGGGNEEVPGDPTMNIQEVEKNGFQMEDYLVIKPQGYDGYATINCYVDVARLKADCSVFLVDAANNEELQRTFPECETPTEFLDAIFKKVDGNRLVMMERGKSQFSNGDVVNLQVQAPNWLYAILNVEINDSTVEYKVEGLKEYKGIDPFQYVDLSYRDLAEIDGEIGYIMSKSAGGYVELPNGKKETIVLNVHIEEGKVYKASDTVHLSVDETWIGPREEKYGEGIFVRTEADVKLSDVMGYLPAGDRVRDIFTYMDEICLDNVDYATKKMMDAVTKTETSVERIGMMFYYDEEGKLFKENDKKFYNQIVFVYKITNEAHPEGWYSYMAYNGYLGVGYELNYGTVALEKCTGDVYGSHMKDDYRYYHNEDERIYKNPSVPMSFKENGVKYPGHLDLADMLAAMKANMPVLEKYDHLIVTEALAELVEEY